MITRKSVKYFLVQRVKYFLVNRLSLRYFRQRVIRIRKRIKHVLRLKMRQLRAFVNTFRPKHFERPNKCCRKEENLGSVEEFGPDTTFQRCAVCGCRHFEQVVDPGEFGISMGGGG